MGGGAVAEAGCGPGGAEGSPRKGGGGEEARRKPWARRALALLYVALVLAAGILLATDLDPKPGGAPSACPAVHGDDDSLLDLAGRTTEAAAQAQLTRWDDCDRSARPEAEAAVDRDYGLVAIIAFGLIAAGIDCLLRPYRRFQWAALIGFVLTATYVVSDIGENILLHRLLNKEGEWSSLLPWLSAVKLGAFLGALPVFLTSLALSLGGVTAKHGDPNPVVQLVSFKYRLKQRLSFSNEVPVGEPEVPVGEPEVPSESREKKKRGVCCSGGGVRSAAFTLGALQAMEEEPERPAPDGAGRSELEGVEVITAVSGGSYMAAAWATARRSDNPRAWSRRSPEEQHLRRHASYMAPGFSGKLWAITRFLLGFTLNLAVFVLASAALFIPYGWGIHHFALQPEALARGATVELPAGGCLDTVDGTFTARPGTKVLLGSHATVALDPAAAAQPPAPETLPATVTVTNGGATVTAEGAGGAVGATTAEGGAALAAAAIGGAATTTSSSTSTTTTTPTGCPAVADAPPSPGSDLRAATPSRTLAKGTRVRLDLAEGLPVRGAGVVTCEGATGDCAMPVVRTLGRETRLVTAPQAVLVLDGPAIVSEGAPVLLKACGDEACESLDVPGGAEKAVLLTLVIAVVAGWLMLMVRAEEGTSRATRRTVRILVSLAAILALAVYVFPMITVWVLRWQGSQRQRAALPAAGTLALIAGFVARLSAFGSSAGTKSPSFVSRVLGKLTPILLRLLSALAGPVIVVAICVLWASLGTRDGLTPGQIGLLVAVAGLLGYTMASGDLNEWSLHPYYRDRLRSAYAADLKVDESRRLRVRTDPLADLPDSPRLVICAAANLADDRVAPPGRPVASWVFSKSGIGCRALGRAITETGEGGMMSPGLLPPQYEHLAWTWTAVAVAGAAFSPAMGKMTRLERFAFALGNLRLGVWYPNPALLGAEGGEDWYKTHRPRPWYLFKEAIGRHKADDRWIYVTDGGHYENLGLVEALRCGCKEIYVFDAAGDKADTFGTLADAMRLARAELGVEVDIDPTAMKPDGDGVSALGVWAGTVRWPDEQEPTGWLVVAKLAVPASAPFDIIDLARSLPSFPTHPTADQLFTDQKFEAYRALGHHLGIEAVTLGQDIRGRVDISDVAQAVSEVNSAHCAQARSRKPACPPKTKEKPEIDKPIGAA